MKRAAISSFTPPALRNEYRSFLQRWEPFGSPDVFHLAMVRTSGYAPLDERIEKLRVVILSIVEGDCEGWALLATRKTGFGDYCQSLDRLGMPGI